MLAAEYKRDMNENYLVIRAGEELDTQSYQVKMLLAGIVPHLLPCHLQSVDGEALLHFQTTSRQSLAKAWEGRELSYEDLLLLFRGFISVMEAMGEYLLTPGMLVMEPDFIYLDAGQRDLFFCYVPGYAREVREQFQALTEYVLPRIDHKDAKAVMLGYAVYRRALEDSFHLEHVKEELYRYREPLPERASAPKGDPYGSAGKPPVSMPSREEAAPAAPRENPAYSVSSAAPSLREDPWGEAGRACEEEEKSPIPRLMAVCGAVVLGLLLVAAKGLGYLPSLPMENLLAGVAIVICVLLLGFSLSAEREKRKRGEKHLRKEKTERERQPRGAEKPGRKERLPAGEEKPLGRESPWQEAEAGRGAPPPRERIRLEREEPWPDLRPEERRELASLLREEEEPHSLYPARIPPERAAYREEDGEEDGETVVLSRGRAPSCPQLVSLGEEGLPSIPLDRELTVIGKLERAVDVRIDLPTISRVHAKIRHRDGEYYLTDLNSKNGTSVDGVLLGAEEEHLLEEGDEVAFAQAKYRFTREPGTAPGS